MTRVLLDANVFIHALGDDAVLRPACARVIEHLRTGGLAGEASSLMIEEIVHVRHRRLGDRAIAVADGRAAGALILLHPVGEEEIDAALRAFGSHPGLQARDAVHLAVARKHGLSTILTTDRGFDGIPGLVRVDPSDSAAIEALAAA